MDFQTGTRVIFGYRTGHHGWRFTGYGISDIQGSVVQNESVDWNRSGEYLRPQFFWVEQWMWMDILARSLQYKSSTTIHNLELAWTYRAHSLKWGELELFVGANYREINDRLSMYDKGDHKIVTAELSGISWVWGGDTDVITTSNTTWQVKNRMVGPNIGFDLTRRNRRWTFGGEASVFLGVNNQSFSFHDGTQMGSSSAIINTSSQPGGAENGGNTGSGSADAERILRASSALSAYMRGTTNFQRYRTVFSPGVGLQLSAKWQWTDAVGIKVGFDTNIMSNVARGGDLIAESSFTETATPLFRFNEAAADGSGNVVGWEYVGANYERTRNSKADFSLRSKDETMVLYGITIGLEFRR